jgi:hypothetical protein
LRDGAQAAELTGYPDGTRIVVRRERPHPGAQLSRFDLDEGMRHQVFLTDTPHGSSGSLHSWKSATVPTPASRTGSAAARPQALDGELTNAELTNAEPKKLRWRLLHVAARVTRGARRIHLRIAETRPWRHDLTTAFARLAALPRPAT